MSVHHHHFTNPRTIGEVVICNADCTEKRGPRIIIHRTPEYDEVHDSIDPPCKAWDCPGKLFDSVAVEVEWEDARA